jgi:diguanylate cyclase (GGDEF)-like protein
MPSGMKAAIDAALNKPSPWPFPASLEACYQATAGAARRHRLHVTLLVAASSIIAALALEAPKTKAEFLYLFAWRSGATAICVLAAFAIKRVRAPWQEAALVSVAALTGMSVVEILGEHAKAPFAAAYMLAAAAFVAGIIASGPVRFGTAIVTCLLCAIAFPLVMLGFPGSLPLGNSRGMPGAALIGFAIVLLATRRNEIHRRGEYLHRFRHEIVELEMTGLNDELQRLSTTDMLTGLANRRQFEREAKRVWDDRDAAPFALALIDVDRFKALNDSAGHAAGDDCLIAVAHALQAALRRDKDRAARYGGEEFIVLAPGITRSAAAELGERLRSSVESLGIPNEGLGGKYVTVSVGVVWHEGRAGSFHAVLGQADRLLYQAKAAGRNAVCSNIPMQDAALNEIS